MAAEDCNRTRSRQPQSSRSSQWLSPGRAASAWVPNSSCPFRLSGGTLLAMVSGFGRSLAGITVDALINTPAIFRSWLARRLTWPIDWRRYAVAFGLPPAIMLLAGALAQEAIDVAVVLNALRALGGELGRNDHLQPPPIRSPLAPTTALPFAPQYQRGYP